MREMRRNTDGHRFGDPGPHDPESAVVSPLQTSLSREQLNVRRAGADKGGAH